MRGSRLRSWTSFDSHVTTPRLLPIRRFRPGADERRRRRAESRSVAAKLKSRPKLLPNIEWNALISTVSSLFASRRECGKASTSPLIDLRFHESRLVTSQGALSTPPRHGIRDLLPRSQGQGRRSINARPEADGRRPSSHETTGATSPCPPSRSSPSSSAMPKKKAPPCRRASRTKASTYTRRSRRCGTCSATPVMIIPA